MFGDTEQLVEFYNTRSDYIASFETIVRENRVDKRASLLLKHAIRLVNVDGYLKALTDIPIPNPDELVSILTKCEDKIKALKFAEYLCTISDSKLIFDCAFELHLKVSV